MGIRADIQLLEVDHVVQLFTLDATIQGGDIFRWHNEQAKGGGNLTGDLEWQAITYSPRPIKVEGLEVKSTGEKSRPKLRIANLEALVTGLILDYDDLIGVKVTRKRTLAKYLDGAPEADTNERFADDVYFIVQKESASRNEVVFVLGDPSDLPNAVIPRRRVSANLCIADYRGEVCQYAGDPVSELDGTPITGPFVDRGVYNPAASYAAKDVVTVIAADGVPHVFCARVPNTGVSVSDATVWAADRCNRRKSRCVLTWRAPTLYKLCGTEVGVKHIGMTTQTMEALDGIEVGMTVAGPGIPAGSKVTAVNRTPENPNDQFFFTIDKDPTATADNVLLTLTMTDASVSLPFDGFLAAARLPS